MLTHFPASRRRDLVRISLHFWKEGDREVRSPHRRAQRLAYERAIAQVLAEIRHLRSFDALVEEYLFSRSRLALVADRACRDADRVRPLSRIWVRDAAFWRRLRLHSLTFG